MWQAVEQTADFAVVGRAKRPPAGGTRSLDLVEKLEVAARAQPIHALAANGSRGGIRTPGQAVNSRLLYR